MAKAKDGSRVKVHYKGTLSDGTVFDSSEGREPFEFTIGSGAVIPGFEREIIGMEENETKTFTIPAKEAYGERREDLMITVHRSQFPPDIEIKLGEQLQIRQPDGKVIIVSIFKIDGDNITLDANHPLAGKDLTFEVTLINVA